MNTYSDEELAGLAVKGDEVALENLIARYLKRVFSFAYRYVHNSADAEDITQETFVKVWRHLKKFDTNKVFRTWVYQIAKNTALDWLKKKSPVPFSAFDMVDGDDWLTQTVVDESQHPETDVDQLLLGNKLKSAVSKLAPPYAEVVNLRHNQEFNFREIAVATHQPLNTIKSRYRRALLLLRKLVQS